MIATGRMSTFGGRDDPDMKNDAGLALYEPREADLRPDLFFPASSDNPNEETWKRLKTTSFYCALRFIQEGSRKVIQQTPVRITNPTTGQFILAFLVDRGPAESTGRLVDLSPAAASALRLVTNKDGCDEAQVETIFL